MAHLVFIDYLTTMHTFFMFLYLSALRSCPTRYRALYQDAFYYYYLLLLLLEMIDHKPLESQAWGS